MVPNVRQVHSDHILGDGIDVKYFRAQRNWQNNYSCWQSGVHIGKLGKGLACFHSAKVFHKKMCWCGGYVFDLVWPRVLLVVSWCKRTWSSQLEIGFWNLNGTFSADQDGIGTRLNRDGVGIWTERWSWPQVSPPCHPSLSNLNRHLHGREENVLLTVG